MEMARPTAVHTRRPQGEESRGTGSPREASPPCPSCTALALLYGHKGSHRKARAEGLREKSHLHPNLHMLSRSKQKRQDLVRTESFISYLKLETATIKILG